MPPILLHHSLCLGGGGGGEGVKEQRTMCGGCLNRYSLFSDELFILSNDLVISTGSLKLYYEILFIRHLLSKLTQD